MSQGPSNGGDRGAERGERGDQSTTRETPRTVDVAQGAAATGAGATSIEAIVSLGESQLPWTWLGVGLVVVGAFARTPGLLLVGALLILSSVVRNLWSRHGLRGLSYERRLLRDRATIGEEVELQVSAWNDKLLPLAWVEADDLVSEGLIVRERPTTRSDRPGFEAVRSTWTLAPYERVTTHLHVSADRRGVYRFGPVRIAVADLFGRDVAGRSDERGDVLLVRPRTVPVDAADARAGAPRRTACTLRPSPRPGAVRGRSAVPARRSAPRRPLARDRAAGAARQQALRAGDEPADRHRARRPDERGAVLDDGLRGGPPRVADRRGRLNRAVPPRRRRCRRAGRERVERQPATHGMGRAVVGPRPAAGHPRHARPTQRLRIVTVLDAARWQCRRGWSRAPRSWSSRGTTR